MRPTRATVTTTKTNANWRGCEEEEAIGASYAIVASSPMIARAAATRRFHTHHARSRSWGWQASREKIQPSTGVASTARGLRDRSAHDCAANPAFVAPASRGEQR